MQQCKIKYTLRMDGESATEICNGYYEKDEKTETIGFTLKKENSVSDMKFVIISDTKLKIVIGGTLNYKLLLTPDKTYSTDIQGCGITITVKVTCKSFSYIKSDNGCSLELKYLLDFQEGTNENQINLTAEF